MSCGTERRYFDEFGRFYSLLHSFVTSDQGVETDKFKMTGRNALMELKIGSHVLFFANPANE